MTETVVVLGATGAIGSAVTAELLARRHHVIAVARDAGRLKDLARRLDGGDHLQALARSVGSESEAAALARELGEQPRRVTAAVAAMRGPFGRGRLLERTGAELLRALELELVPNFVAARHLLPLLAGDPPGLYLALGGPVAACGWSGYGQVSIASAANQMLVQVLREEAKDLPVIVQQLQVGTPVRSAANADCACPDWIGADAVARRVAALIEQRNPRIPVVQLGAEAGGHRLRPVAGSRSVP